MKSLFRIAAHQVGASKIYRQNKPVVFGLRLQPLDTLQRSQSHRFVEIAGGTENRGDFVVAFKDRRVDDRQRDFVLPR